MDKYAWTGVLRIYVVFYICMSFFANINSLFTDMSSASRLSILGRNPNGLAFSCGIVMLLLFYSLLIRKYSRWWKTCLHCFALISVIFTIIATGSRGGAIAVGIGLLVVTFLAFQSHRLKRYVFFIPIVIGVALFFGSSNESVLRSRMQAAIDGTDMGDRPEIGKMALEIFKDNFFWGIGTDYVFKLGSMTNKLKRATHNAYLQIAVSFGLLGLIPFLGFLFSTLFNAWKNRRVDNGSAMVGIQVMLLVFFISASAAYSKDVWILFALIQNVGIVHRLGFYNQAGENISIFNYHSMYQHR